LPHRNLAKAASDSECPLKSVEYSNIKVNGMV
jgi:hypothetical protein